MRDKIKKTERFVFGLFTIAVFMSWGVFRCIDRMLNIIPTTLAELISYPIPTALLTVPYVIWLIWLSRQVYVRILRGSLFPINMEVSET